MTGNDSDLINAWLHDGDERAFSALMTRYQEQVFYLVRSMVLDVEDAKDVTQKAFIKAFNNLKRLRKKDNFRGWLFKIAVNLARDHLRTRRKHLALEPWTEKGTQITPERRMMDREIKRHLKEALLSLPPRQQEVVSLRLLKGLSFKEISHLLDMKEKTARTNFHFGLKALRALMAQRGLRP